MIDLSDDEQAPLRDLVDQFTFEIEELTEVTPQDFIQSIDKSLSDLDKKGDFPVQEEHRFCVLANLYNRMCRDYDDISSRSRKALMTELILSFAQELEPYLLEVKRGEVREALLSNPQFTDLSLFRRRFNELPGLNWVLVDSSDLRPYQTEDQLIGFRNSMATLNPGVSLTGRCPTCQQEPTASHRRSQVFLG